MSHCCISKCGCAYIIGAIVVDVGVVGVVDVVVVIAVCDGVVCAIIIAVVASISAFSFFRFVKVEKRKLHAMPGNKKKEEYVNMSGKLLKIELMVRKLNHSIDKLLEMEEMRMLCFICL